MSSRRSSGILLHLTCLPGPYGIGDLGPEAYDFADFLKSCRQRIWQILPLGHTGFGDSPYQLFSAFAGNPLLISPQLLREEGLLDAADLADLWAFPTDQVAYGPVIAWKTNLLRHAYARFERDASAAQRHKFQDFCTRHCSWLDDYALFIALKESHGVDKIWTQWEPAISTRQPDALDRWRAKLASPIENLKFQQFLFFQQWDNLRRFCNQGSIQLIGDIPIYVAHDSADVWANPDLFQLDAAGNPTVIAGVPPDYFSSTGQCWGNPIYRWAEMAETGFRWWVDRFRATFQTVDRVRLDHFRGFQAYWEVPGTEKTAVNGRWVEGPGAALFEAVHKELGDLPIIAENLGVITPEVEAMRTRFGFPGMSVLQFAFGLDPQAPSFKPHNYLRDIFAYTGTHDNDSVMGWWTSDGSTDSTRTPEQVRREKAFAMRYLNTDGSEMNWTLIRALLASVAETAIVPLQDILGAGSESRMNTPGTSSGNWRWRFQKGDLTPANAARLKELTEIYDRI